MQNVQTIKQCDQRHIAVLPAKKVVASPLELQLPNNDIQKKAFPIVCSVGISAWTPA